MGISTMSVMLRRDFHVLARPCAGGCPGSRGRRCGPGSGEQHAVLNFVSLLIELVEEVVQAVEVLVAGPEQSFSATEVLIRTVNGEIEPDAVFQQRFSHSPIFSVRQGAMAPSNTDRLLSGITRSGSMPSTEPKPSQGWQAP